jgi:hypothetical protein
LFVTRKNFDGKKRCEHEEMQSPSLASPKTLKLHARKQRAQSGQQTSNGPLNLSGIFGSSQLSNSIFQSSGGNWQSQAPGADAADVYERFDYLSKLKEENEALMSLLKVRLLGV